MNRDELEMIVKDGMKFRLWVVRKLERHEGYIKAMMGMLIGSIGIIMTVVGVILRLVGA